MDEENRAALSIEYGINHRSPLLALQHCNMCNGSLVSDVMHDLLEGVLQYEIYYCKFILCHHTLQHHGEFRAWVYGDTESSYSNLQKKPFELKITC